MAHKLPAAVGTKPSRFGNCNLEIASRRWPGTQTRTFFFQVIFPQVFPSLFLLICALTSYNFSFSHSFCVDSCADFSQFQCQISGVEPRWKANCQLQRGHNHQDLGLAIWRLPVDADQALGLVSFFVFSRLVPVDTCPDYHNYRVHSVAWSPDGKQIASGSSDNTIKIWDSQSGSCQSTLTGHSGE